MLTSAAGGSGQADGGCGGPSCVSAEGAAEAAAAGGGAGVEGAAVEAAAADAAGATVLRVAVVHAAMRRSDDVRQTPMAPTVRLEARKSRWVIGRAYRGRRAAIPTVRSL